MMNTKPIVCGDNLIVIERNRYEELIAKEERLRLIEKVIKKSPYYTTVGNIKDVFDLNVEDNKNG